MPIATADREAGAGDEATAGGMLWVVSARDGAKVAELPLDSAPAWDGLAAAGRRLYVATVDGHLVCFAGKP